MPAKPFTPTDNEAFNQAVAAANKFSDEGVQVSKDDQLRLYGLFKFSIGEEAPKGGLFDPTRRYMYDAYKKVVDEGKTVKEAQDEYVALVDKLKASGDKA
ncbi:uncharacterized protein UV8b_04417 [Ustilaginoidea virens]|uniref:ACB domain-containing protein n=1 Tax=Ustilaginoidea virens TaxID=1159556 RepID=A0A8E5MHQ2_USTVR|nr:uncharacterized protein UV8b_04417 [Ustilaginoidea virens]QUC20176.1 hypothetical protein UV8b_04417 [Ustilaginoidea virens]